MQEKQGHYSDPVPSSNRKESDRKEADDLYGQPIAYRPMFSVLGGSVTTGVFLAQAYYWSKNKTVVAREGWFYKSEKEWSSETGLSRDQQETSRRELERRGLLEHRIGGNCHNTRSYRLNTALLRQTAETVREWQSRNGGVDLMSKAAKQEVERLLQNPVVPQSTADIPPTSSAFFHPPTCGESPQLLVGKPLNHLPENPTTALAGKPLNYLWENPSTHTETTEETTFTETTKTTEDYKDFAESRPLAGSQESGEKAFPLDSGRDAFEDWYEQYPVHAHKEKAQEEWEKLNPDEETIQKIFEGLERWENSGQWAQYEVRYKQHPARWLELRAWEDYPASAAKPQKSRTEEWIDRGRQNMDTSFDRLRAMADQMPEDGSQAGYQSQAGIGKSDTDTYGNAYGTLSRNPSRFAW